MEINKTKQLKRYTYERITTFCRQRISQYQQQESLIIQSGDNKTPQFDTLHHQEFGNMKYTEGTGPGEALYYRTYNPRAAGAGALPPRNSELTASSKSLPSSQKQQRHQQQTQQGGYQKNIVGMDQVGERYSHVYESPVTEPEPMPVLHGQPGYRRKNDNAT